MKTASFAPLHDAILQAWECAFADAPAVYLSGPIKTGRKHVERLRAGGLSPRSERAVFEENCEALRATAALLRRRRGEAVVEPASLNIAGWSQPDYHALWGDFIARYVKLVIFIPGWEYSFGCASEFERALRAGVRTESLSGSTITVEEGLALLTAAHRDLSSGARASEPALKRLASDLQSAIAAVDLRRRPKAAVTSSPLRKDASLDLLAERGMNVAQFVSFAPDRGEAKQQFARIAGCPANVPFAGHREAIASLLAASAEHSVNVRSYEPSSPRSREFIYGLKNADDAAAAVARLSGEGLHTIVNETVDVHDGGVSGVLMGDVLEFAPDDTPRCVEKPGTAALPRGWGRELLSTVYGFAVALDVQLASRLEFSLHPRPRGWRRSNVLVWEYSEQPYVDAKPQLRWPNRFSSMLGDKSFGLLVAHHAGLPVPFTTVISRRVAPFSFGRPTGSGETWIRTAPAEQVPGKFTTHHGWLDPFALLQSEDPDGQILQSVIAQQGVPQCHSGALIAVRSGEVIIEGKSGEGETFMLGTAAPEKLPASVENDVAALYEQAAAALGPVGFEWVHDGGRAWVVQLHSGATDSAPGRITGLDAERWQVFDVRAGLEGLRKVIAQLEPGTGILLSGRVGLTSHFAEAIRLANIPARMG